MQTWKIGALKIKTKIGKEIIVVPGATGKTRTKYRHVQINRWGKLKRRAKFPHHGGEQ